MSGRQHQQPCLIDLGPTERDVLQDGAWRAQGASAGENLLRSRRRTVLDEHLAKRLAARVIDTVDHEAECPLSHTNASWMSGQTRSQSRAVD